MTDATEKRCGCGAVHDAAAWAALPLVGEMRLDGDVALEMRNCSCGSTIAVSLCVAPGCRERSAWTTEDGLVDYCDAHANEWLTAEESIERREVAA